jgi:hypothetical protein
LKTVPSWAIRFHDYAAEAARARIHTLEDRGVFTLFRPTARFHARHARAGHGPRLRGTTIDKASVPLLLTVARAMQDRPLYLVTELVGQSLEAGSDPVTPG